jgi:hypothetical protein
MARRWEVGASRRSTAEPVGRARLHAGQGMSGLPARDGLRPHRVADQGDTGVPAAWLQSGPGMHRLRAPHSMGRPGLRICRCGRFFKPAGQDGPTEPELRIWLEWAEAIFQGDAAAAQQASRRLPPLLHDMTLDGAYRLVEAFGLLERPGAPVRNVRHSSARLFEVGAVLTRGLRRLFEVGRAENVEPQSFGDVHLPVLAELAEDPAAETDGHRAAWLLDLHRAMRPSGVRRVGARPRRQMPLFL